MHTLKVQLGLTLSVLLTLSMFLFGLVILILWQRSAIRQETQVSETLLQMAALHLQSADISQNNQASIPPEFLTVLKQNDITCLQWQLTNRATNSPLGSCPTGTHLAPLLQEAADKGTTRSSLSGIIWNGFFFTRENLLVTTFFQTEDGVQGTIGLVRSLQDISSAINKIQSIFYGYLVVNVLVFATIGFTRLVHIVIRPIQRLARLADSRADQSDASFFLGEGLGEFTQLSLSLNRLVTRIDGDKKELRLTVDSLKKANDELQRNRKEMLRTEKLASIGRLSAGLAHEIGNPLGIIQGYIELLAGNSLSDTDRELFSQKAVQELTRINTLIRNLLDLSRTPTAETVVPVEIHALLHELIGTVRIRKTTAAISFATDLHATHTEVTIDSDGLRQVFLNCLLNSIDAIEEKQSSGKESIQISTNNEKIEEKEYILISLVDSGTGINQDHIENIFDPFFTTKEVGKGTGLGLTVAHNLIKKSGGKLNVTSTEGQGTTLFVRLPVSA